MRWLASSLSAGRRDGVVLNADRSIPAKRVIRQCFEALFNLRWPDGFICPNCGHNKSYHLNTCKLRQCDQCHRQTSIIVGTIFESSKLPLTIGVQAIYLLTQTQKGISAMQLHRQLGSSYNAVWQMKHKLMQVRRPEVFRCRLTQAGCAHEAVISGGGRATVENPEFYWVNTVSGNLKTALRSSITLSTRKMHRAGWRNLNFASIVDTVCRT